MPICPGPGRSLFCLTLWLLPWPFRLGVWYGEISYAHSFLFHVTRIRTLQSSNANRTERGLFYSESVRQKPINYRCLWANLLPRSFTYPSGRRQGFTWKCEIQLCINKALIRRCRCEHVLPGYLGFAECVDNSLWDSISKYLWVDSCTFLFGQCITQFLTSDCTRKT